MIMEDIKDNILARTGIVLGAEFQELAYIEDVEQNNWNQISKGYGVRAGEANEISGVNKVYTLSQVFEVVVTERFLHSQKSDKKLVDESFNLRDKCLNIYKDMLNTKVGSSPGVLNVLNLFISSPEVDIESKVVIQRMEFSVIYRISLI